MKKKIKFIQIQKIYTGILLFLINLIFFYFCTYIDKKSDFPIFLYFCFIIIIFFLYYACQEFLNLNNKNKNYLNQIIIFFSCFFIFLISCSIITNYFIHINKIIELSHKIKNSYLFNLFQYFYYKNNFFLFYFLFFLLFLFIYFLFSSHFRTQQLQNALLIFLYISFFSSCFFSLIMLNYKWFFYLFLITISSDSFAFFGGIFFGKNLLCSKISPKKTWEGFFCGIFFTILITFLFFIKNFFLSYSILSFLYFILFTLINSIISQIGDLINSKFKRDFQIKDFNNILPGHGGLLDRFDSILFLSFFVILIFVGPWENFQEIILNFL
jgi:phosphatidate cytidylyltransferase